ncbi:MAG: hypothetical protein QOE60_232 [Thermoleophilaceae bacterium]|nr:hypothetical protein [Thermoleophilaceae bacterium]
MDPLQTAETEARQGELLAEITNGIVRLFAEYYGRGPTRAKSYLLDGAYLVTVLRDTMTTVERTLADGGHGEQVRAVRLVFQEAMAESFVGVVESALGRRVAGYHSQLLVDADIGFELFVLEEEEAG